MNVVHETPQKELRKQKRRARRRVRLAHAQGMLQGIISMLRSGDIVLDCGANVGEISAQLSQSDAHIHAFEPDPFAFEKLSERLEQKPNVTLHNVAVGTKAGSVKLMRALEFDKNPLGSSVKSTILKGGRNIDESEDLAISVPIINLPDLIEGLIQKNGRIAFLKMDIEGAELDVLEAMLSRDLFEHIDLTVAETHEGKFRELTPRFEALRAACAERYPVTKVNLDWI